MKHSKLKHNKLPYKLLIYSFISFCLSLMVGVLVSIKLSNDLKKLEYARTSAVATTFASSVKSVLDRTLTATRSLAVMVYQCKGHVESFADLSKFLLPMYKGAYALSLAPNGIIRQVEPLNRNLIVRGHDLFEGQDKDKVISSLSENKIDFFGPFELIQGPIGAIGKLPVFLSDNGRRYFWGYTVVTLELPDALEDANLKAMVSQGYAYLLSGVDPHTHEVRILSSSHIPVTGGVCEDIPIADIKWKLCVSPIASNKVKDQKWFEFILIFSVSLSIGGLTYVFFKLRKTTSDLAKIALFDPLTNLPNRRQMFRVLEKTIFSNSLNNYVSAIIYIDLDGFKSINDNLGHKQGDQLLVAAALRICDAVDTNDLVSRIGGDEFVIIIKNIYSYEELNKKIKGVLKMVSKRLFLKGEVVRISASIGVILINKGSQYSADFLLSEADKAMYVAKASGKNMFYLKEI
ncbi:sensor domain-containing diguanylate cyclase [Phytobacter sp. RSE-02]|uniref:sensor domain-containing diguanylate cyclase n=1 Tax=Phytobacter sp. RSE-02 TaxID=3229229 RepID=UPI00339D3864